MAYERASVVVARMLRACVRVSAARAAAWAIGRRAAAAPAWAEISIHQWCTLNTRPTTPACIHRGIVGRQNKCRYSSVYRTQCTVGPYSTVYLVKAVQFSRCPTLGQFRKHSLIPDRRTQALIWLHCIICALSIVSVSCRHFEVADRFCRGWC
eukprot:COSAG02_NODE_6550_length_3501_cov_4.747795_3_plen_153_part_00